MLLAQGRRTHTAMFTTGWTSFFVRRPASKQPMQTVQTEHLLVQARMTEQPAPEHACVGVSTLAEPDLPTAQEQDHGGVLGPFHFELRASSYGCAFNKRLDTQSIHRHLAPAAPARATRRRPGRGSTLLCRACPGGDWGRARAKNHNQTTQRPSSTHLPTSGQRNPAAAQRQPSGRRTTARPPFCRTHTSQLHQRRRAAS